MNIGQASKASGVSAKMIRYYEQTGLIPAADRRASGYRDYSTTDVHMLRFIRRARDLGFPIPEIAQLVARDGGLDDGDSAEAIGKLAQAPEHVAVVGSKEARLNENAAQKLLPQRGSWKPQKN